MDHGLPEEIMEGEEVERQNNWSERYGLCFVRDKIELLLCFI